MRRTCLRILVVLVAAVAVIIGVLAAVPVRYRSIAFARAADAWSSHWPFRGKGLIARSGSILSRLGIVQPVRVAVEPNLMMLVDPVDLVGRSILVRREWESDTWALLDRHLPRGGTLVDIGAHIGYFSLKGANKVGPEGRIIAIEPHPITSTFLRENVALNAANQVSIHQIACSDREGVLDFFSGASRNIGTASLSSENSVLYSREVPHKYRVKSRPLDDVIAEVAPKRVDVIKADVEGAEMLVLRGAVRTIHHYKPAFVLEMRDDLLRNLGSSVSELRRFLGDLGYVEAHRLEENSEWIPR